MKYKTKWLGNTVAAGDNTVLENITIVVIDDHSKCHWLIAKLSWNLDWRSIVF